jgi:hypothetical protein
VIGTAYTFIRKLYPYLELRQRVKLSVRLTLHAGRQSHQPVLPSAFDKDEVTLDLEDRTFGDVFLDLVLGLLRAGGTSVTRSEVKEQLDDFYSKNILE